MSLFKRRPNSGDVIDRTFAVAALMIRSTLESAFSDGRFDEEGDDVLAGLQDWVEREGIGKAFSALERRLFDANLGEWSEREIIDASWTIECLGVFLWALQRLDSLRAYDTAYNYDLSEIIRIDVPKSGFAKSLRQTQQIDRQRDISEMWHWRSVNARFQFEEVIDPTTSKEERLQFALSAAASAFRRGDIPELIDGDFPAFGTAYKDVTRDELSELASIARERERAFNWLAGYEWNWDEVPVDT